MQEDYNFLSYDIFFNRIFFEQIKPTKAKQGTNYRKKTSLLYLYLYTKIFISLSKIPKTNPSLKNISKKKETKKTFFFPYPRCSKAFSSLYKTHYQKPKTNLYHPSYSTKECPSSHHRNSLFYYSNSNSVHPHPIPPQKKTLRHFPQNDKANSKKQQGIFLRMTKRIKTQQYIQYSPPYLFNKETP